MQPQQTLIRAIDFAARAHRTQRRKDAAKTPYINHPIEVMQLLSEGGVTDTDVLAAAVLHDTIEDTGVTYESLKSLFGENIANIVQECTDDKSLPKVERKKRQISHAMEISIGARLVKAADKLSNIGDLDSNPPKHWRPEEINGYFVWSYSVWRNLRGCNQYLDGRLTEIFNRRNLLSLTESDLEEQLAKYYKVINKSE